MGVTYDAGALIAALRSDRRMWALHRAALGLRDTITVPAVVLAQVWRDGARQVQLARLLAGCEIEGFGPDLAKAVGGLLARSGTSDIVDAALVITAVRRGDLVVTSDPDDLTTLAGTLGVRLRLHVLW